MNFTGFISAWWNERHRMEIRTFGATNRNVSLIGFGSAPIGLLATEQKAVAEVLNTLLDHGVNLIDTAAMYLGAEEAIGRAVAHRRDEYVLVSKCGQSYPGLEGEPWSAKLITQTVDRALRRLKTDRLDVMLLHSCDLETLKKGEALEALVEARRAGKIRFAGYSGDNEAVNFAAGLNDVAVIETSVNVCDQANLDTLLPAARRRNLGVIAKRPLANAAWKDLSAQPGFYAEYAATYTERLAKMNVRPVDLGFDGDPAQVWPEIALRFTLAQPGVHTAVVGTTNLDHALENVRIAEKGPLADDAVLRLRDAFRRAEAESGEKWLAQT